MKMYHNNFIQIYFGDAGDNVYPDKHRQQGTLSVLAQQAFTKISSVMPLESLKFLHQVHGTDGYTITKQTVSTLQPFVQDGDFLTTNLKQVGLGVLTADCLPIVLYDAKNLAVAVIHAGWKGTVAGIAPKTLEAMQQSYGTCVQDVQVFFGPSARVCCYGVTREFVHGIEQFPFASLVVQWQGAQPFFDLPGFNKHLLEQAGVSQQAFISTHNLCTICHDDYYSYRRQAQAAGRQMTVVSLV